MEKLVEDAAGNAIKIGDHVEFDIDSEKHFGVVKKVDTETNEIEVSHVIHAPRAVLHHIQADDVTIVEEHHHK